MTNVTRIAAACLMFVLASAAGAADKQSPLTVKGARTVSTAEAKALFDKGVAFVDVRNDKDWRAGRIPGAEHIELNKAFNEASLSKVVKKDEAVCIYCNGPSCPRSSAASAQAVGWGFSKVYYYRDGYPAWKAAGYPVE